jgi:hypothetical protein
MKEVEATVRFILQPPSFIPCFPPMIPHKIAIKLYATSQDIDESKFVPIFHTWIQTHAVADHLLIDVADYEHLHDGPGTVLVAHEANIYADRLDGRLGLTYSRKQLVNGDLAERTRQAISAATTIATMLELDPAFEGKLSFKRDELSVKIFDRLRAPNTPETFAATRDALQSATTDALGGNVKIEYVPASPLDAFSVTIKSV